MINGREINQLSNNPAAPPRKASKKLSVMSWRRIRPRPARGGGSNLTFARDHSAEDQIAKVAAGRSQYKEDKSREDAE